MNKKKQSVNRKHRKTKSRLKRLNDLSLKSRKKKIPIIHKETPKEIITNEVKAKETVEKKPVTKKTTAKKTTAKKTTAKKTTAKKIAKKTTTKKK